MPQLGTGERQAVNYFSRAQASFVKQHRACLPRRPRILEQRALAPDRGSPGQALLSTFGVLRLPTSKGVRTAASTAAQWARPFVRYARIAQRRFGYTFVVVPVTNLVQMPSARCFRLELAALSAVLGRAPTPIRARVLQIGNEELRDQQYIRAHPDGLCVVGGGGATCESFLLSRARGELMGGSSAGSPMLYVYLVPNGVAKVTVRYSPDRPAARQRTRQSPVTVRVTNNLAVWMVEPGQAGSQPASIAWRAASGRVIRTVALDL